MIALAVSAFVVLSRFVSVTPILHRFKAGTRISFIPALNLSQISEFSLVICALGVALATSSKKSCRYWYSPSSSPRCCQRTLSSTTIRSISG